MIFNHAFFYPPKFHKQIRLPIFAVRILEVERDG